jgi:hypothetical protein
VAGVWLIGAAVVAVAIRMAADGEVGWIECAGVRCRDRWHLPGGAAGVARVRSVGSTDGRSEVRKPLRETRQRRAAVWWLFEHGLAAAAPMVCTPSGSSGSRSSLASSRVQHVLPAGATLLDVLVVGGIAWFAARMLDSLWLVMRAAILRADRADEVAMRHLVAEVPQFVRAPLMCSRIRAASYILSILS